MSADPKPVELTEAESEGLIDAIQDGTQDAFAARIKAAARREALLEGDAIRVEAEQCLMSLRAKIARVEALASRYYRRREWAVATEIRIALAEPERDEESGR